MFLLKLIVVKGNPIGPIDGCKTEQNSCDNLNELCEFIPLPHLLCEQEKIKQQCPGLCNSCPTTAGIHYISFELICYHVAYLHSIVISHFMCYVYFI